MFRFETKSTMSRRTEEEIARMQDDLIGIDEEIRRLELQEAMERQSRRESFDSTGSRTVANYGHRSVPLQMGYYPPSSSGYPVPEFGGGGYGYYPNLYPQQQQQQSFVSPLGSPYMMVVPQPTPLGGLYMSPAAYPSGYYQPQQMGGYPGIYGAGAPQPSPPQQQSSH